ncbi:MAG: FISUMP domain-containing protein [Ignavibacteriaceae bacterium]|jgi:uncharacterized protein (TIGR02145 family)
MMKLILLISLVIGFETVYAQETDSVKFKCGVSTIQYAGQTYHTVKIGSQCWLKENLNVGTMIPVSQDQTTKVGVIEKYCYNDDSANCKNQGGLYQWNEAMQYSSESTQGICPSGWHIPGADEFQTLESAVSLSGNALKARGQGLGDGAGTNTSGFSALLAGFRHHEGYYDGLNVYSCFWSSTEGDPETSYFVRLTNVGVKIYVYDYNKNYGLSIRCIKD